MTNLKTLLKTLVATLAFILIPAASMAVSDDAAKETGTPSAHQEKHEFFPKKPADKSRATRLATAELLEPKALSAVTGTSVTLKWKAVEGADVYRLQVATDPNFKWLVSQQDFVKDTSFQVNDLKAGEHYFWRIYAWNTQADPSWMSSYSSVSSFSVK